MINYIGIDISKQILHVNNGEKYLKFNHTKKLNDLKKWLSKNYDLKNIVLIFEATGSYSKNLKQQNYSKKELTDKFLNFYEKMNYRINSVLKNDRGNGIDTIYYYKRLSATND